MKNILVVGATNIDIVAKSYNELKLYDKNPGVALFSYGGVARNICENLARLNIPLNFATIIGNDEVGRNAISYLNNLNVKTYYKTSHLPTSTFISILDADADSYISISSMDIVADLDEEFLSTIDYTDYDLIVSDANSPKIAKFLASQNKTIFIDATSDAKARNISGIIDSISYLKCTSTEMDEIFNTKNIEEVIKIHSNLTLIVTNKDQPITYNIDNNIYTKNVNKVEVVNAIGAGDSFSAGIIYGLHKGYNIDRCIEIGIKVSAHSISQNETVSTKLNEKVIGE